MVHRIRQFLLLSTFLCTLAGVPGYAQVIADAADGGDQSRDTLRMTMAKLETTFYFRLAKLVYSDAFSRLGYKSEVYSFPSERALIEANSGRLDGEAGRVMFDSASERKYPNLIRSDHDSGHGLSVVVVPPTGYYRMVK